VIIVSILLAAVGFVALLTGLLGNTRPIGGGIVAIVLFIIIGRWGFGLLHDTGLLAVILFPLLAVVSCGVSALGFILYMVITAVKGTYTIKLGVVGSIVFICVAVISFVGIFYVDQMTAWWKNYQEEAKNRQEEMAVRDSFPPAYRELCTPAEKGSIYNKSPEQAWALYQNLRVLLREKPLDTKDQRNDAVFTLLRRTVRGIAKDKNLQQLQEKRLELLRDAETFWQTGDAHNKNKFVAAIIIDGNTFDRPGPADGSIRERVLALKKDIIQARLTKPEPDDHLELLFSILFWEADDAARKRSFDEFFDRSLKYSWEDAEYAAQVVSLFGGQNAQENGIQAITSLIPGPVPTEARGLYYGLYVKTHNDRWLVLADPTILFKNSPKLLDQKLFFLSEISMLRGEFENSLKERAEYILSKGFGSFGNESTLLHGYYALGLGSCEGIYVYVTDVNAEREKYIPCGYSDKYKGLCVVSDIYPGKIVTYHFSPCGDRDYVVLNGRKKDTSYREDDYSGYSSEAIGNIFTDFERMARSACLPEEKPCLPATPAQRDCVLDVIKRMDIHMEPASSASRSGSWYKR